MQNAEVSNPKDQAVVSFHNSEAFDFTPVMGCMFDGRPVNGASGAPGIQAGETKVMPYHIGWQLARNLAKRVFNTSQAASVDQQGIPTGVPVWNPDKLNELAQTYIKELYVDARPVTMSETDKLMARMAELEKFKETIEAKQETPPQPPMDNDHVAPGAEKFPEAKVYLDKQEVISELEKRAIKFDRRQNKANLEKLL